MKYFKAWAVFQLLLRVRVSVSGKSSARQQGFSDSLTDCCKLLKESLTCYNLALISVVLAIVSFVVFMSYYSPYEKVAIMLRRRTISSFNNGCLMLSGYSVDGRPPFIPMKTAQWCMNFPGLKIPGSDAVLPPAHRASAVETLLLRWYVTSVEPTTSGLALR